MVISRRTWTVQNQLPIALGQAVTRAEARSPPGVRPHRTASDGPQLPMAAERHLGRQRRRRHRDCSRSAAGRLADEQRDARCSGGSGATSAVAGPRPVRRSTRRPRRPTADDHGRRQPPGGCRRRAQHHLGHRSGRASPPCSSCCSCWVSPRCSPTPHSRRCCRCSSTPTISASATHGCRVPSCSATTSSAHRSERSCLQQGWPGPSSPRPCSLRCRSSSSLGSPPPRARCVRSPTPTSSTTSPKAFGGSSTTPRYGRWLWSSSPSTSRGAPPGRYSCSTRSTTSTCQRWVSGCSRRLPPWVVCSAP